MGRELLSNTSEDFQASFKPLVRKLLPRKNLHTQHRRTRSSDGYGAVLLWRGAAFPAGPRTFRGGQRGFKGGPLTLTLRPPDFRRLRGQHCWWGPSFLDVTRAAALLDMVTVVLGPNCPTVLKHSAPRPHAARSLSHAHPPAHFAAQPNSKSRLPGTKGRRANGSGVAACRMMLCYLERGRRDWVTLPATSTSMFMCVCQVRPDM